MYVYVCLRVCMCVCVCLCVFVCVCVVREIEMPDYKVVADEAVKRYSSSQLPPVIEFSSCGRCVLCSLSAVPRSRLHFWTDAASSCEEEEQERKWKTKSG